MGIRSGHGRMLSPDEQRANDAEHDHLRATKTCPHEACGGAALEETKRSAAGHPRVTFRCLGPCGTAWDVPDMTSAEVHARYDAPASSR